NEPGADRVHRETVHPSRKRATQSVIYQRDRRGFLGSAGCQPAVSGSLPETVAFRCSTNVNRGAAAGCRGQQAGSLRSPDKKILPRRTRDARDAFDQSQRPQESNEAASVQTPDLVSPRTTTLTRHRETVRVHEMRMSCAKKLRFCIHSISERFDTAGAIAGQTTRHVVGTFHQERAQ